MKADTRLTPDIVQDIKLRLWLGQTQESIAQIHRVSQTTVHRILHGLQWSEVVWPDGTQGGIPASRVANLWVKHCKPMAGMAKSLFDPPNTPNQILIGTPDDDIGEVDVEEVDVEEVVKKATMDRAERDRMLGDLAERADAAMEEEIADAITSIGDTSRDGPDHTPEPITDWPSIEWKEVLRKAPKIALVKASQNSEGLKKAVLAVFYALPHNKWDTPLAYKLVGDMMMDMGITEDAPERGRKKGKKEKKDEHYN